MTEDQAVAYARYLYWGIHYNVRIPFKWFRYGLCIPTIPLVYKGLAQWCVDEPRFSHNMVADYLERYPEVAKAYQGVSVPDVRGEYRYFEVMNIAEAEAGHRSVGLRFGMNAMERGRWCDG